MKNHSSRGAVSVFLSIILVPVIALTSAFADLGRVRLARNLAEASGDLSLNSLLTHYDFDLNDFYGMVASCQNTEEFYDGSKGCFERLLKSTGLCEEELNTLWDQATAYFGGLSKSDKITDLLHIEVESNKIFALENASLANPVVIKDQIVDFMKYRAPVAILAGIVDRLTKSEAKTVLEEARKNESLVGSKQEYAKAEAEFLKAAFESYVKMRELDKKEYEPGQQLSVNTFETVLGHINGAKTDMREINPPAISGPRAQLETDKAFLQAVSDEITVIIDGDGKKNGVPSLESLAESAKEYVQALKDWGKEARTGPKTEMHSKDTDEFSNIDGAFAQKLTVESVSETKTRLTNIKSQITALINAIDGVTCADKEEIKLANLTNKETDPDLGIYPFPGTTEPTKAQADGFYPTLPGMGAKIPDLYLAMYRKFGPAGKATVDEEQKKINGYKDDGNKNKEEGESKDADRTGGVELGTNIKGDGGFSDASAFPSGLSGDNAANLTNLISGIGGIVSNLVSGNFTAERDKIYATVYMMEMFSHAAYEAEAKYNLFGGKKKAGGDPIKLTDVIDYNFFSLNQKSDSIYLKPPFMPEKEGDGFKEPFDGTWLSKRSKDTYNKSLTTKLINKDNNHAYQAEIEYILYGGANSENLTSAYLNIYAIRFALNTISGFQHFWSMGKNDTGDSIANLSIGISAATAGVIPESVIKSILIVLLSAAESAMDLKRLRAGFPVEIYKTKATYGESDWVIDINTLIGEPGENKDDHKMSGLFYSDYLMIFVYAAFGDGKDATAQAMYRRIGDVIQANMRKVTGFTAYSLQKSIVYFKLEAKLRVRPLLIALPISSPYYDDPNGNGDWCTFSVNVTRGYS